MRARIVELADRQDGVLGRAQLLALGVPASRIDSWVKTGRLRLLFRGSYALGHVALRPDGWWRAALLSCGPHVAIGGASGLQLHGALPFRAGKVAVTTRRALRGQLGLRVHRTRRLARVDVTLVRGLAVTTLERTLLDHGARVPYPTLRAIADEPANLSPEALRACLARNPGHPGSGAILRLLARDEARTKSAFERRFARFCAKHGIRPPDARNRWTGAHKVDVRYEAERLVVELDGRAHHQRRAQMRADRRRDSDLQLADWSVLRLVWEDLDPEWELETARRLRSMLALRGGGVLQGRS